ncbi:large ribosomal subunit protein uL15x-like [Henckelia pumila]|uniref:large ribosomal subunit protein uL15x-like n=1 Tax=Henckelia pumila TaxID=405737 RepID=UPI003C6DC9F5
MTTRFKKNRKKHGHVSAGHGCIFHKLRNKFFCPTINVDQLWSMVSQEVKNKASKDNVPLIDVTQFGMPKFGYFKVLGKDLLPADKPVVVKAKLMEKKIKEAGGAVVLAA